MGHPLVNTHLSFHRDPKKATHHHETSSSSKKVEYQCFISKEYEDFYTRDLHRRGFIKERGIKLEELPFEARHWRMGCESLVKQPQAKNTQLVREFYPNVPSHKDKKITVRANWFNLIPKLSMKSFHYQMKYKLIAIRNSKRIPILWKLLVT